MQPCPKQGYNFTFTSTRKIGYGFIMAVAFYGN